MYRRRNRRYYALGPPKKATVRTEETWTVKTDAAGRKRYYKNDCFMSVSAVPEDIYERLKTENHIRCPVNKTLTYFDAIPMDLKKLLMLYFSVHNIKKLCDIPTFAPIYDNDDFWYKLFSDHFTSKHKINTSSHSFRGWRSIYLYFTNMFNREEDIEKLTLQAFNANGNCMDRKIAIYVKDLKNIYFLYYVMLRLIEVGEHTFPIVKSIIEERHLDWISIYQYAREHTDDALSFARKYNINFSRDEMPITGKSLDQMQYFLKFLSPEHHYYGKILNSAFKKCLFHINMTALEYLLKEYPKSAFNLNKRLLDTKVNNKHSRVEIMKFLIENGANPHINDDELIIRMALDNDVISLRFLVKQGLNPQARNNEA